MSEAEDFYVWLDKAPVTGILPWPAMRASAEIKQKAAAEGVCHGRITLWLWIERGWKVGFAMARRGGDGGDRAVRRIDGPPPRHDGDKGEITYEGERE